MPTDGIAKRITCVAAFAALVVGSADTAAAQSGCAKLWFRVAADGAKAAAALPWEGGRDRRGGRSRVSHRGPGESHAQVGEGNAQG